MKKVALVSLCLMLVATMALGAIAASAEEVLTIASTEHTDMEIGDAPAQQGEEEASSNNEENGDGGETDGDLPQEPAAPATEDDIEDQTPDIAPEAQADAVAEAPELSPESDADLARFVAGEQHMLRLLNGEGQTAPLDGSVMAIGAEYAARITFTVDVAIDPNCEYSYRLPGALVGRGVILSDSGSVAARVTASELKVLFQDSVNEIILQDGAASFNVDILVALDGELAQGAAFVNTHVALAGGSASATIAIAQPAAVASAEPTIVAEAPKPAEETVVPGIIPEPNEELTDEGAEAGEPADEIIEDEIIEDEIIEGEIIEGEIIEGEIIEGEQDQDGETAESDIEIIDEETPLSDGLPTPRSVSVASTLGSSIAVGDLFQLSATLTGFDGAAYTTQWQYNDGNGWSDCEGSGLTLDVVANANTVNYGWRLVVTEQPAADRVAA